MTISPDEPTEEFHSLAGYLESFLAAWDENAAPPNIADFAPHGPLGFRRETLIELIKVDLEYRRQHNAAVKAVVDYGADFPELLIEGEPPCDLLYEEFHLRKHAGEEVSLADYIAQFPNEGAKLQGLFQLTARDPTSALRAAPSSERDATTRGPQKAAAFSPGQRIDDFDLIIRLGQGSFASVFLARQRSMQRLVALKISADEGVEPQTLAQLDHPNIVRVYDVRTLVEEKVRLMYMQYLPGGTIQGVVKKINQTPPEERTGKLLVDAVREQLVQQGQDSDMDVAAVKRLSNATWPETVCRLGVELAMALQYAHDKGTLHRDIKPANVLLSATCVPKLADFNISFAGQVEGDDPFANFGGSMSYMSPEQLEACSLYGTRPDQLDAHTDIYSLGLMLWELLYGERPFDDDAVKGEWNSVLPQLQSMRAKGPPPMDPARKQHAEDTEAQLCRVLEQCMAPHRNDRYATGEELARRLQLCLQPAALHLLMPAQHGWRRAARRFPITAFLMAALIPNVLAALFNYAYNEPGIVAQLAEANNPGVSATFHTLVFFINGTLFPVGVGLLAFLGWRMGGHLDPPPDRGDYSPDELQRNRRQALALGGWGALIGVAEWCIAGLAYPICLHLLSGGLEVSHFIHFFLSLTLCGLIAAVYPFFFVTLLAVRVFYPALLRKSLSAESDRPALVDLSRRAGMFLMGAGVVPALGVFATVVVQATTNSPVGYANTLALVVLSLLGAFGFAIAFGVYRIIQQDTTALVEAIASPDVFNTATEIR